MNAIASTMSPSATNLIRMDHTKVMAAFHKYQADASPGTKQAIVNTICRALEIHAQLEEEIFYPAVREVDPELVANNVPEHDEMRRLMQALQTMSPEEVGFDRTFLHLMRTVIHHVADEETVLLPEAERALGDRVNELGAAMTKRKLQLSMPHVGEMTWNAARAMPASTLLIGAGALLAGSFLLKNAMRR
jgi:hemerythrin superfamily protein